MEHYQPHPGAAFEGYYSKFDLPSGAHIALIICTVPGARERPHKISFTYVPAAGSDQPIYQKQLYVPELDMVSDPASSDDNSKDVDEDEDEDFAGPDLPASSIAFEQRFPGGLIRCHRPLSSSVTTYSISTADYTFHARTTSRTPWTPTSSTPEGILVHLPLPLHWHVHSLSSACTFSLSIPGYAVPAADAKGTAHVHQEKNWAHSFPAAHIWIQARDTATDSGICIAGGQILGLEAFLIGYSSPGGEDKSVTFAPPYATRIGLPGLRGVSPSLGFERSWEERRVEVVAQSWTRKIVVRARAPRGTFFALDSPFAEGHRENFLGQSFQARIEVEVYEAEGWVFGGWRLVEEVAFEGGSLEFGGAYYPPAGTKERIN